jgi:phage shock protein A
MTQVDRVPWLEGVHLGGRSLRVSSQEAAHVRRARELEKQVARLRREAVTELLRQEQLVARLATCEALAEPVEDEAAHALTCGQERLALLVLSRGLPALARRDLAREELSAARRRAIQLLRDAALLDERARRAHATES